MTEYYLNFFNDNFANRIMWATSLCLYNASAVIIHVNDDEVVAVKIGAGLPADYVAECLAFASLPAAYVMLKYPQIQVKSSLRIVE